MEECICVYSEDADPVRLINVEDRKARKYHFCGECGEVIYPGEIYLYTFYRYDGESVSHKLCKSCENIRETMMSCWCYNTMWEDIFYVLREDAEDAEEEDDVIQMMPWIIRSQEIEKRGEIANFFEEKGFNVPRKKILNISAKWFKGLRNWSNRISSNINNNIPWDFNIDPSHEAMQLPDYIRKCIQEGPQNTD